jgi:hypothetical protein
MNAVARWAFVLARRIMPPHRRPWAEAMHAESSYLPPGAALRWSLGCLFAACKERFVPLNTGDFRISRWVMLIETLGCFGFLTLGWFEITFGASGVVRHTADIVATYYVAYPGGSFIFTMLLLGSIVGIAGPIGLFLGLRYVIAGRALGSRALGYALIAGLVAYALAGALGYFVGPPDFRGDAGFTLLFVLLPVACIAHLMVLARPAAPSPPRADMAATT